MRLDLRIREAMLADMQGVAGERDLKRSWAPSDAPCEPEHGCGQGGHDQHRQIVRYREPVCDKHQGPKGGKTPDCRDHPRDQWIAGKERQGRPGVVFLDEDVRACRCQNQDRAFPEISLRLGIGWMTWVCSGNLAGQFSGSVLTWWITMLKPSVADGAAKCRVIWWNCASVAAKG